MSDPDRQFVRKHPWRWALRFWPHWTLMFALLVIGIAINSAIFEVVAGARVWPGAMILLSALVAVSAVWPLNLRVQAIVAGALVGVSTFRIVVYMQALTSPIIPDNYNPIIICLIAHWAIVASVGVLWPRVSELCALKATVAAGREILGPCNGSA